MKKRRSIKKRTSKRAKPIGFVKEAKGYKLVFGSKTKPRMGKKTFKKKASLEKEARKYF